MSEIIILKGEDIPQYWRRVLEMNADVERIEELSVIRRFNGKATTLWHAPSGQVLCAEITSVESCYVELEKDDQERAYERKPEVDECYTTYRCGPVTLRFYESDDNDLTPDNYS